MTVHDQAQHEEARRRPDAATDGRKSADPAGDPILTSKIMAPDVPAWTVQRPRITEVIARGTRWCPLTVITGPPGAGKTMALALWAAAEPRAVAWVSVDEYDNRPGVFWSYAIEALRRVGVAILQAGAGWEQADDHVLVLRLAAALAANDPPVTLVLDDLHLLTTPQVLRELDFVLRNAGAGLRLAVSSRIDPLLPLHRYRVSGHLAEIRAADLAFSSAEAGQLLAQHGITLPAASLECLVRRTEGWAAGLRLAALSMDAHPDPGQFVTELAAEHSTLTGYLMEEVLNAQPPQTRDVLFCTSILEEVSTDAAIEMTGDEQAAGILSAAARLPGPGGRTASASGPMVRPERSAHSGGPARRPGRRLAARSRHGHRRPGDRPDHRAWKRPAAGRRVRRPAPWPIMDRSAAVPGRGRAGVVRWPRRVMRRRARRRGRPPRARSCRPGARVPAGGRDDPAYCRAARRRPGRGGGGRGPRGAAAQPDPGREAGPASWYQPTGAVRPRSRRVVVRPPGRGRQPARRGGGRRNCLGSARTS